MAVAVQSRSPFARSWNEFLYVASGLPLGLAWLITLCVLLAVGVSTVVVTIGVPVLAFTLVLWRWGADTERQRAALVLGAPIPRPARRRPASPRLLDRMVAPLRDGSTWRDLGYLLLFGPIGIVAGTITVALWSAAFAALLVPVFAGSAPDGSAARSDRDGRRRARARRRACRSPRWPRSSPACSPRAARPSPRACSPPTAPS